MHAEAADLIKAIGFNDRVGRRAAAIRGIRHELLRHEIQGRSSKDRTGSNGQRGGVDAGKAGGP